MRGGTRKRVLDRGASLLRSIGSGNASTAAIAVAFGPGPGDRAIERPRRAGELRQIARWVGRHHWTAQVVLALMAVAVAAVVFVVGLVVFGSLLIMANLDANMMPSMDQLMKMQR